MGPGQQYEIKQRDDHGQSKLDVICRVSGIHKAGYPVNEFIVGITHNVNQHGSDEEVEDDDCAPKESRL